MAHFGKIVQNLNISAAIRIVAAVPEETYTVYIIEVTIGTYTWTVRHRYSDFREIHEKLVAGYNLDKSLLPPKKLFGNQSESFIKKRQQELEIYLQTILYYLSPKIPTALAFFLDFNKYEIHGITQALAEELYNKGESILQTNEVFEMTPLQLFAVTERLKLPEPTCDSGDVKKDIGHILDFITRVKALKITGSQDPHGTSNINMNELDFDLTLFKSLQKVEILTCNPKAIGGLETIKQTLQSLNITSTLSSLREFFLQDSAYWQADDGTLLVDYWSNITSADFSNNSITKIDDSVQLMPKVERLDLSNNKLETIEHLQWLSQMTFLNLSSNLLRNLDSLHTKLGNLKTLLLANNLIEDLHGFSKLFSLTTLDISNNEVAKISEVKHLSNLPCLENLYMVGNPVTVTLDYRTKVLELFGDRVAEIILDNQRPSQKELDTVAVLQALQKSKDNKEKVKRLTPKKVPSTSSLTESSHLLQGSNSPDFTGEKTNGNNPSPGKNSTQSETPVLQAHVETLRQQAGCNWLHIFNNETEADRKKKSSPVFPTSADKCSSLSRQKEDRVMVPHKPESNQKDNKNGSYSILLLNYSDLPKKRNQDFVHWIDCEFSGVRNSKNEAMLHSSLPREPVVDILWCLAVQYSVPDIPFVCCAILTKSNLFIQKVTNLHSDFPGVPDFEPFYILPLRNIQQVVIGCCFSFIRFEESFVFEVGTFNLIGLDSVDLKNFVDSFKHVCKANPPDIIDLSSSSEMVNNIFLCKEKSAIPFDRIVFAAVVREKSSFDRSLLLLSETQIHLLPEEFIVWPLPTFESSSRDFPDFSSLQTHPVVVSISDINLHQIDQTREFCNNPETKDHYAVRFIEYGLSMIVHESEGNQTFNIYFLSSFYRELFLDRLTSLRAEYSNKMLPTFRQEPEGGNESIDYNVSLKEPVSSVTCSLPSSLDKHYMSKVHHGRYPADELSIQVKLNFSFPNDIQRHDADAELFAAIGKQHEKVESSMKVSYLTEELECHLKNCVRKRYQEIKLPPKLKVLTLMDGNSLVNFFHSNISIQERTDYLTEELRHVVWTVVIPYDNHNQEIATLVMLSTLAVYLVSSPVHSQVSKRPPWMTHSRHQSDSVLGWKTKDVHQNDSSDNRIKPYCILKYTDLQQVNVGLFDQCVRLTGREASSVFTLVFRDSCITGEFLDQLTNILSLIVKSPVTDRDKKDMEADFYRAFMKRTKSTTEGLEYTHPSQVRFCYPGDDAVEDILYLVNNQMHSSTVVNEILWMFILCYTVPLDFTEFSSADVKPTSLIMTSTYICLAEEDLVTYPLPDFVRGLPENPRHKILDARKIEDLKCLVLPNHNDHLLCLVFADEQEEIVVDTTFDHFSGKETAKGRLPRPEYKVMIYIQSISEKQKLVYLLGKHWKELNPEVGRILDIVSEPF